MPFTPNIAAEVQVFNQADNERAVLNGFVFFLIELLLAQSCLSKRAYNYLMKEMFFWREGGEGGGHKACIRFGQQCWEILDGT